MFGMSLAVIRLALLFRRTVDFFNAAVERCGQRVPEMQKSVLLQADVHEHRLQAHFDVLDPALVNASDDVARAASLDAIFFEPAVLQQRDATLEFFYAQNELVVGLVWGKAKKFFYFV